MDRESIAHGLHELGLARGDHLVVHTALSSFGRVEGGPEALLGALLDVVGPEGTVMAPTMTWRSNYLRSPDPPFPAGIRPYDPATSAPDPDMGRTPVALLGWPGARRSPHPLMSVAAVGALAPLLTDAHPTDDPLLPYRTLAAHGGRVLLLGVDHTRNTTIHAAEFLENLPHLTGPGFAMLRDDAAARGYRIELLPREPDCSLGFDALNDRLPRQERQIGGCVAWLLDGQVVIDGARARLRADRGALLCDHPGCRTCARGRRLYAADARPAAR